MDSHLAMQTAADVLTFYLGLALALSLSEFRIRRKNANLIFAALTLLSVGACFTLGGLSTSPHASYFFELALCFPGTLALFLVTRDSFFKVLFNFWSQMDVLILASLISGLLTLPVGWGAACFALRTALLLLVMLLYVKKVRGPFRMVVDSVKMGWAVIAFIPICIYVLTYLLSLFVSSPFLIHFCIFMLYALFILIYTVIYITFRNTYQLMAQIQTEQNLRIQVEMQKKQLSLIDEKLEEAKIFRHDLHHHLTVISANLTDGNIEAAQQYIRELSRGIERTRVKTYCQNYSVNAILSAYITRAEDMGIHVTAHVQIPREIAVNDLELSVIFANCVENAAEACAALPPGEKKWLDILAKPKGRMLTIQIRNSFHGKIQFYDNRLPVSRKSGPGGTGCRSVVSIVHKHHGVADFSAQGNVFTVRIVLNNSCIPAPGGAANPVPPCPAPQEDSAC